MCKKNVPKITDGLCKSTQDDTNEIYQILPEIITYVPNICISSRFSPFTGLINILNESTKISITFPF